MPGRFQPGNHLHVFRQVAGLPAGYYHHGIYISTDRVIQFGGGVPLLHKDSTGVGAVTLAAFENGGTATVVRHGYESRVTGWHPPADEPWKIIERAEFLLKLQPKLPYNLIGHNCEHMATLCAVNRWAESYQVRRGFAVKALISAATLMTISVLNRRNVPVPGWLQAFAVGSTIAGLAARSSYNRGIKKLWDEIRDDWFAFERMLEDDPRNETS